MTTAIPIMAQSIDDSRTTDEVANNVNNVLAAVSADPFEHPMVPPTLPVSQWPHPSVFLQVGSDTTRSMLPSTGTSDSVTTAVTAVPPAHSTPQPQAALPIGVPFPFESPTFRGQFLLRLRNSTCDDPKSQQDYFRDRKRVLQTVVQGQFKKSIPMSDLYVGTVFRQPIKYPPPPLFMRILRGMFQRIAPGVILDFTSNKPRVVALYAGSAKTMSVHRPGQEPNIRSIALPESLSNLVKTQPPFETNGNRRNASKNRKNAQLLKTDPGEWSLADRQRILSHPDTACHYSFDTEHVYTMEIYDESMDYGKYAIKLPVYGNFTLSAVIGYQPMTFTAVTKQNEIVYDFGVWHESIVPPQRP